MVRNIIVFDHHIAAKTINYRKILGNWYFSGSDDVYATIRGSSFRSTQSIFTNFHDNCEISETIDHTESDHGNLNWLSTWEAHAKYRGNDHRIFTRQNALFSTHIVIYNGTDYELPKKWPAGSPTYDLSLTHDCPP